MPVIALVGTIGEDAPINFAAGIDTFVSILEEPTPLEDAIANRPKRVMRCLLVGQKLKRVP